MSTTIEASTATSVPQTTSSDDTTKSQVELLRARTDSIQDVISNLAESLTGYASRTVPESSRNQRLFGRIERLVTSITRLVEALALYRKSSSEAEGASTKETPIPAVEPSTSTDEAPDTPAATTESDSGAVTETSDQCSPTCCDDPEPVGTDKPATAAKEIPIGTLLPVTRGFLWKAVSDGDGKLVVLIPKRFTGQVKQVRVLDPKSTKVLAKGRYSGVGNGDREYYRFTKPGGEYPDGAIVVIEMKNGSVQHVKIRETSKRTER